MDRSNVPRELFLGFIQSILRDFARLASAFVIGTIIAALICLYYGFSITLSLFGGFIVLGIALAISIGM